MPATIRKIVYACSHELPNLSFQAPQKPSVIKRIKRALTFTETIRTPSLELCPYCKRKKEEKMQREAELQHRPQAPTRPETSPRYGNPLPPAPRSQTTTIQARRRNTVAARRPISPVSPVSQVSPVSEMGFGSDADPDTVLPPRNPYRDTNMELLREDFHARDMEERLRDSLARESPADRRARLFREEKVRKEWTARSAAREYNEFIQDQALPAAAPSDLKELFIQARTPRTSIAPQTESQSPRLDLRARAAKIKEEKATKEQRIKARCQLVRKEEIAIAIFFLRGWQYAPCYSQWNVEKPAESKLFRNSIRTSREWSTASMTATRVVVYRCTHELPDTEAYIQRAHAAPYQYRNPIVNRLRRAFTLNETVRRPSMDLCPVCQAKSRQRSRPAPQAQPSPRPRGQTIQDRTHPVHAPQLRIPTPARDSPDSASSQPLVPQPWNMAESPPDLPVLLPPRNTVTPPPQANEKLSNMAEGPPDLPRDRLSATDQRTAMEPPREFHRLARLRRAHSGMGCDETSRCTPTKSCKTRASKACKRCPTQIVPITTLASAKGPWCTPRVHAWIRQQTSETLKKHHDRITQPLEPQSSESRPRTPVILIPDPLTLTPSTTRGEEERGEERGESPTDPGMSLGNPSLIFLSSSSELLSLTNRKAKKPNQTTHPQTNNMVNHLVFECGHRFPEFPSKLKKLKRALSIRRALSTKAKVPKDIARAGLCEVCADFSVQDFLAAGTHAENVNKTFAQLREERVKEAIAAAKEAAEREGEEESTPKLQHPTPQHHLKRKPVPESAAIGPFDGEEDDDTEWLLAKDPEE
ncbi:uncharacterized protein Bfra_009360 [Botrytis fragariae]|uniref:Uncharacterized protein n=1 Tax=Botrytis fragariae TaxID=1964551 RepID=A0A8H6ANC9_9HELO|nr:uncharacterized protein Bfra_009360 [Botrytis fragariae]KAF5870806.1 hypothetical protein Bfra_009360 [Botrytis fragariae]